MVLELNYYFKILNYKFGEKLLKTATCRCNAAVVNNPTLGENHDQKLTNLLTFVKLQLVCSCVISIRII